MTTSLKENLPVLTLSVRELHIAPLCFPLCFAAPIFLLRKAQAYRTKNKQNKIKHKTKTQNRSLCRYTIRRERAVKKKGKDAIILKYINGSNQHAAYFKLTQYYMSVRSQLKTYTTKKRGKEYPFWRPSSLYE